jgi:hypothetical protein
MSLMGPAVSEGEGGRSRPVDTIEVLFGERPAVFFEPFCS